jgi:hypothetical protein
MRLVSLANKNFLLIVLPNGGATGFKPLATLQITLVIEPSKTMLLPLSCIRKIQSCITGMRREKRQKCRESRRNPLKIRLPYQLQLLPQLCRLGIFHQMRGMCLSSFINEEASRTSYQRRSKERYFMNQQSSGRAAFPISDDIKVKLKASWYGPQELSFFVPFGTQQVGLPT